MLKISLWRRAAVALARGDLDSARRWADEAVARTTGWHRAVALTARAKVAIAQGDTQQAERDAQGALSEATEVDGLLGIADTLDPCGSGLPVRVAFRIRPAVRRRRWYPPTNRRGPLPDFPGYV